MTQNLRSLLFYITFASGMKRLLILLCLQLAVFTTQAMTDSLLMAQVAHTGVLLKQMQFDSALVQVDRLMPAAKQNHNMLAQATLHAVAGMALSRSHQLEKGLQEYMRCADIAEEHHLLVKAMNEKTGTLLTLFSTVYGELSFNYQEQGNKVEALHYARIALRWVSHANSPESRIIVMASIMPAIAGNKEWRTAYELMQQAFADALQLEQYDFALVMATYLMTGEDECFGHGPYDSQWMQQANKILPQATTQQARLRYEQVRRALVSKYDNRRETVQNNQTNDSGPTAEDTMTMATPKQDAVAGSEEPLSVNEEESTDYTFPLLWVVAGTVLFIIALLLWRRRAKKAQQKTTERQMDEKYREGQEYERNRLARELHDGVSNQLLAVEMKLSTDGLSTDAMQLLDESREQVRRVSHELLQPEFSRTTLPQALANYADEMNGVRGCNVTFTATPADNDWTFIPATTALDLYRIVQELVANALKHSGASMISVGLHHDGSKGVMVIVSHNGENKDTQANGSNGIGMRNIKHRAEMLGGKLELMQHQYGRVAKLVVTMG